MSYKIADCPNCGGNILVVPCKDFVDGKEAMVVSHGTCDSCLKNVCLPSEPYREFVNQHCERI